MADVKLSWTASPSPNATGYGVQWTFNGAPAAAVTVPRSPGGDVSGYDLLYSANNPAALANGDVVGCSIHAVDSVNNIVSTDVTPGSVTVSIAPPPPTLDPPTLVTLVQV